MFLKENLLYRQKVQVNVGVPAEKYKIRRLKLARAKTALRNVAIEP